MPSFSLSFTYVTDLKAFVPLSTIVSVLLLSVCNFKRIPKLQEREASEKWQIWPIHKERPEISYALALSVAALELTLIL